MSKNLAIISGGNRGIGKAVATKLASLNYDLVLIARNAERLAEAKADILKYYNINIDTYPIDVSHKNEIQRCVEEVYKRHGRIDVLFNNAGISTSGNIEMSPDELDKMIQVNLYGTFYLTHFVVPYMKQKKSGYIINLGSRSAVIARSFLLGYAASKFALRGMSESLYRDLAPLGIKVTCINPGFVDTDMSTADIPDNEKLQVEDIAEAIEFLLKLSPCAHIKEFVIEASRQTNDH